MKKTTTIDTPVPGVAFAITRRPGETEAQFRTRMRRNETQRIRMHSKSGPRRKYERGAVSNLPDYLRAWRAVNRERANYLGQQWRIKRRMTDWPAALLTRLRGRAKRKGLIFTIGQEWVRDNWTGFCQVTGMRFVFKRGQQNWLSASVDRVDNSKGYTPENCRFVINGFNTLKGTLSDSQAHEIARAIVAHSNRLDTIGFCA